MCYYFGLGGAKELNAGSLVCWVDPLYPSELHLLTIHPFLGVEDGTQGLCIPRLLSCTLGPSLTVLPHMVLHFAPGKAKPVLIDPFCRGDLIFTSVLVPCDCLQESPTWWLKMPDIDFLTGLRVHV